MCARYYPETDYRALERFFRFSENELLPSQLKKDIEVFPRHKAPVIYAPQPNGKITLAMMEWSMRLRTDYPSEPDPSLSTFNARSETISEKPMFRKQWGERLRCIIPVKSFVEFQQGPSPKKKLAITLPGESPMVCIAGLWDEFRGLSLEKIQCFTMLTCAPNEQMKPIHDRMPVILTDWKAYLDPRTTPDQAKTLLRPYDGALKIEYAGY